MTVTAGYVAEIGLTMDTNSVVMLKLKVINPKKSNKPTMIKNRKINLVGTEIFVFVNPTQENKADIATALTSKSAIIGPAAATMGLTRAYVIPQAIIDRMPSITPLCCPCFMLFFSSVKFADARKMPTKTIVMPVICNDVNCSLKRKTANKVVTIAQLAEIGDTMDKLPF